MLGKVQHRLKMLASRRWLRKEPSPTSMRRDGIEFKDRTVLLPACLRNGGARALANEAIVRLERKRDTAALANWIEKAEASSRFLAPTIVHPTVYQMAWTLRFHTQTLELPTLLVLEQIIGRLHCGFVDVGAHVGYFSIAAHAAGADSILAIELHEPNFRLLCVNVPNAHCLHSAAGARAGTVEYFVGRGHSNHSLYNRDDTSTDRVTVPMVALDELIGERALKPHVVKIDAQGAEPQVLLGYQKGLSAGTPVIVFEVEQHQKRGVLDPPYTEAINLLQAADYRVFAVCEEELIEIAGAKDQIFHALPVSSNLLAVSRRNFELFDRALHDRRPEAHFEPPPACPANP